MPDGGTVGTVHVEARLQAAGPGQGLWSAFWLAPVDKKYGSEWPLSGEVRAALPRGQPPVGAVGTGMSWRWLSGHHAEQC